MRCPLGVTLMSSEYSVTGLNDMEVGISEPFFRTDDFGITFAVRYSVPCS